MTNRGLKIEIGAFLDENPNDFDVTIPCGPMQRRSAILNSNLEENTNSLFDRRAKDTENERETCEGENSFDIKLVSTHNTLLLYTHTHTHRERERNRDTVRGTWKRARRKQKRERERESERERRKKATNPELERERERARQRVGPPFCESARTHITTHTLTHTHTHNSSRSKHFLCMFVVWALVSARSDFLLSARFLPLLFILPLWPCRSSYISIVSLSRARPLYVLALTSFSIFLHVFLV